MDHGLAASPVLDAQRPDQLRPDMDPAPRLSSANVDTGNHSKSGRSTLVPNASEVNAFAFTFSEDDLIPDDVDPYQAESGGFGGSQQDQSPVTSYNRRPAAIRRDSKITIERTLFVSEDGDEVERPPGSDGKSRQTHEAGPDQPDRRVFDQSKQDLEESALGTKSQRLSRTFTSLSRNAALGRTISSPVLAPDPIDKEARLRPVLPSRNKTSDVSHKRQSYVRSRGESPRAPNPEAPKLSRNGSVLGRKFRSLRDNSPFRQTSDTPADKSELSSSPSRRPKTPLIKSFSNNSLTSMSLKDRLGTSSPQTLGQPASKKHYSLSTPKKRDALWSAFRDLDADFAKFQAKSIALKPGIVRSSLLYFLRHHASDLTETGLQPEDLDRRTTILDRWWTGLLELLFTKVGLSSTGAERLLVMDAMSGIMERPEWRMAFSSSSTGTDGIDETLGRRPNSGDSAKSSASDFVRESVYHNIRTTFAHNLAVQMRFVVDRMTPTHVSPSISGFCGKTCAYAFFYSPGIADVLVSLWNIKAIDIHRILRASGFQRGRSLHGPAAPISTAFPRSVQPLAYSSIRGTMQTLQRARTPAFGLEKILWRGNWQGRWCGRDTDLFYSFVKQYHILVASIVPPSVTKEDLLCVPGMVLVSTQMLINLDATIHRRASQAAADPGGVDTSVTFDSLLAADAAPTTALNTPVNAARLAAENRLLMLMREMADDVSVPNPAVSMLFAQSLKRVLHAATQSTSLFDHGACFTLCDILQEALPGLIHFQARLSPEQPLLDWQFWLNVFRRIIQSQNTTSEIRLYSLLFAIWEPLAKDEQRVAQLCLGLLLDQDHFHRTFRHWCPMVRAYYMRLLCWRVARCDGFADSEIDVMIVTLLMKRLQELWARFQLSVQYADVKGLLLPPTAPCNPAPGRKLLIIRTDTSLMNNLMSFRRMMSNGQTGSSERTSSDDEYDDINDDAHGAPSASLLERVVSSMESGEKARRRSGILRTILGYGTSDSRSRSRSPKPPSEEPVTRKRAGSESSNEDTSTNASPAKRPGSSSRMSMYESRPSPNSSPEKAKTASDSHATPKRITKHVPAAFKFSLEPTDRRPQALPPNMVLSSPRLPLAAQALLHDQEDMHQDMTLADLGMKSAEAARYSGRAFAEWTLVVNECQNFFERRRNEGVPTNALVETPTLGVESFRKPG